jgi:hypothetical protein
MTDKQFRELCLSRPFQPFDLHMADGRTIPVSHPELICPTSEKRSFGVGRPDGEIEHIQLSLVKSVTPRPRATGKPGK